MELYVNIQKKLQGFELDLSFTASGDILGLLGASGSGKSMTLRCIAGIETPDQGRIVLNGRTLFDSEKGINLSCRKRKLGYLFQNYALFPNMTVEENIGFGIGNKKRDERKAIIREKVKMIKLEGLEKRYPSQLSGGQQQRVALARALAVDPEVLLLDEPFSALDDYLRSQMVKQLTETLADYSGVTLFVTHNMDEVYRVCEKLAVLSMGKMEAMGRKEEVFKYPPSLVAAQLTGCKNFSAARYIAPFELEALEWGMRLKTKRRISNLINNVGVHAHTLEIALDENEENVFRCWPKYASETPSRIIIYLELDNAQPKQDYYHLQWEISKQTWTTLQDKPQPWRLKINPDDLMII
ncbi:ABC-type sulfate/molybdate transport systems, ATPase component [Desulfosporosinus orientis DSM 765]|uniref:ABC-type sulfate/molybdate transport systems, ATPase component n=1 Tax=Desulfosporosinus orientis (strain ATCC 19365 / DSM 765 / NCIMB 8382 / VKM B-1628 / Singapore I) TaxID=768706 RepID=G7W7P0_DESOD|nr:sulfate/molybdate ABC transporter ATP-binding protein [Desulfosporosinus orientis]AET66105.1 ABC-type sulfate/molybdate transport systems, ATPase component [Desulfosporosinus orientis DSM 765]